jgi:hypothetical protein
MLVDLVVIVGVKKLAKMKIINTCQNCKKETRHTGKLFIGDKQSSWEFHCDICGRLNLAVLPANIDWIKSKVTKFKTYDSSFGDG